MRAVLLTISCVLALASSFPAPVQIDRNSCLVMTPDRQVQIDYIERQVKELLLQLGNKFEDIDITDVLINVNKRNNVKAQKYMTLSVTVNDCANVKDVFGIDEVYFDESKPVRAKLHGNEEELSTNNTDSEEELSTNNTDSEEEVNDIESDEESEVTDNLEHEDSVSTESVTKESTEDEAHINVSEAVSESVKQSPEILLLSLSDKEQKLVHEMGKKRGTKHFWVIENDLGQRELKFF